jgi:hypothetical protein
MQQPPRRYDSAVAFLRLSLDWERPRDFFRAGEGPYAPRGDDSESGIRPNPFIPFPHREEVRRQPRRSRAKVPRRLPSVILSRRFGALSGARRGFCSPLRAKSKNPGYGILRLARQPRSLRMTDTARPCPTTLQGTKHQPTLLMNAGKLGCRPDSIRSRTNNLLLPEKYPAFTQAEMDDTARPEFTSLWQQEVSFARSSFIGNPTNARTRFLRTTEILSVFLHGDRLYLQDPRYEQFIAKKLLSRPPRF